MVPDCGLSGWVGCGSGPAGHGTSAGTSDGGPAAAVPGPPPEGGGDEGHGRAVGGGALHSRHATLSAVLPVSHSEHVQAAIAGPFRRADPLYRSAFPHTPARPRPGYADPPVGTVRS
ncbi:hypothetical protein Sya03_50910 [Spirilliplanes yamanashiensis]|uniref:Uncharacterized protein n=1 Tax=Spirilliplanes yamanashiensis TaxID=42233 RepID=A0A8J3YD65_9ACTN|nr:hypothetical protein Sya03_50910 [Spirilliplanes yamanashiensis]